jgi:hypothetical protein
VIVTRPRTRVRVALGALATVAGLGAAAIIVTMSWLGRLSPAGPCASACPSSSSGSG